MPALCVYMCVCAGVCVHLDMYTLWHCRSEAALPLLYCIAAAVLLCHCCAVLPLLCCLAIAALLRHCYAVLPRFHHFATVVLPCHYYRYCVILPLFRYFAIVVLPCCCHAACRFLAGLLLSSHLVAVTRHCRLHAAMPQSLFAFHCTCYLPASSLA